MSIKKWIGMGLCGLIAGTGVTFAQGDMMAQIDEAFKAGTLKGNLGVNYINLDVENGFHESVAAGFVELEYMTGSYEGLQLGIDVLGVGELLDDENAVALDFPGYYNNDDMDAILRELYVKYSMMNSDIVVGRHQPMVAPMLDGTAYEGVTLNIGEWTDMGLMVCVSAFNRWIDDATWDDGVDDWQDVETGDTGDILYSVMANVEVMDKMVDVKPYLVYQADAATVYGIQAAMDYEIEGGMVGATFDYYFVSEDVGNAAITDDSSAWKLYVSGEMEGASAGIGYFQYSDDGNQLGAQGLLDDLDVMDDEIMEMAGVNFTTQGAEVWWIDLGYKWEGLTLAAQYGNFEDDNTWDYDQWMLKATYDVTESFQAMAEYIEGDDDDLGFEPTMIQIYGVYKF